MTSLIDGPRTVFITVRLNLYCSLSLRSNESCKEQMNPTKYETELTLPTSLRLELTF